MNGRGKSGHSSFSQRNLEEKLEQSGNFKVSK